MNYVSCCTNVCRGSKLCTYIQTHYIHVHMPRQFVTVTELFIVHSGLYCSISWMCCCSLPVAAQIDPEKDEPRQKAKPYARKAVSATFFYCMRILDKKGLSKMLLVATYFTWLKKSLKLYVCLAIIWLTEVSCYIFFSLVEHSLPSQ